MSTAPVPPSERKGGPKVGPRAHYRKFKKNRYRPDPSAHPLIHELDELMRFYGVSITELSRVSHVSEQTLRNWWQGVQVDKQGACVTKLARAFGALGYDLRPFPKEPA